MGIEISPGKVGKVRRVAWPGTHRRVLYTNDHFPTDATKHENVAPSPSAVKCRTAAPGCPWAGEGAYPTLSYK
jgi:hypothetical protein